MELPMPLEEEMLLERARQISTAMRQMAERLRQQHQTTQEILHLNIEAEDAYCLKKLNDLILNKI